MRICLLSPKVVRPLGLTRAATTRSKPGLSHSRRTAQQFEEEFATLLSKGEFSLFCLHCGKPIFLECECEDLDNKDKLIQPADIPAPLPATATSADRCAWHTALMNK